jgi:hypothetical protein
MVAVLWWVGVERDVRRLHHSLANVIHMLSCTPCFDGCVKAHTVIFELLLVVEYSVSCNCLQHSLHAATVNAAAQSLLPDASCSTDTATPAMLASSDTTKQLLTHITCPVLHAQHIPSTEQQQTDRLSLKVTIWQCNSYTISQVIC